MFSRVISAVVTSALVAASLVGITVVNAPAAQAVTQLTQMAGFNARAWTMTQPDANGVRYLGGDFTNFNAWMTGSGGWVNTTTGEVDPSFGAISDYTEVYASVPDGSGGVYIAGTFSQVGSTARNKVAHVLADGSVDPNFVPPTINERVLAISVSDSAVFIGGRFVLVGGITRNFVAALDRTTGALLNWNPSANGHVLSITVKDSVVYLGGRFSTIGSTARNLAAAVRLDGRTGGASGTCLSNYDTTDCLTAFAPPITSGYGVFDIAVDNNYAYLGGELSATENSTTIATLIRTNPTTGAMDTAWNPNIAGNTTTGVNTASNPAGPRVYAMDMNGSTLYVGGKFTSVGGQPRTRLAAFDLSTGALSNTWAPSTTAGGAYNNDNNIEIQDGVSALDVDGSRVYVGGGFFSVNGVARNRAAAVDATTGATLDFDPKVCDLDNGIASHVFTASSLGGTVFFGGNFFCMGGLKRYHAAAVQSNGLLDDWSPLVDGPVQAFSSNGSTVYMVGRFLTVNGASRQYAAAVTTAENVTAWNPLLDVSICEGAEPQTVLQTSNTVYVGGCFTTVGAVSRTGVAATDPTTGAVDTNFNANVGQASVRSLAISGSRLYIGGNFTTVDSQSRTWIAAVNPSTGALDSGWDAGPIVTAYDAGVRKAIYAMEPSPDENRLYIGGFFGTINGQTQRYLAALDLATGALDTSWRPSLGSSSAGGLYALDHFGGKVYVAGRNGAPVLGTAFGAVNVADASVSSWMNSSATTEIRGISATDAAVFIAGSFTEVAGVARSHTAAIDVSGTMLDPWPMDQDANAPLSISISGSAGGVTSNPGGINCGGACEYAYDIGSTVTLTAVEMNAVPFGGWSGDCTGTSLTCTVSLNASRQVTAWFGSSPPSQQNGGSTPTEDATSNAGDPAATSQVTTTSITARIAKTQSRPSGLRTIKVRGTTTGLAAGTKLYPQVKIGRSEFKTGKAVLVAADGTYSWSRQVPSCVKVQARFSDNAGLQSRTLTWYVLGQTGAVRHAGTGDISRCRT